MVIHNETTSCVAGWLNLAASPAFAAMAVLVRVFDGGAGTMDSMARSASPLGGMIPMYVLMAVFHSGPWLKWLGSALAASNWQSTPPSNLDLCDHRDVV